MGKAMADAADAELALLQVLWERGRANAREITETIYSAAEASQIATVQKLLTRLEVKRLIKRDRGQHVHTFTPAISREAFAGRQLEKMAERLTEGSLVPFMTHMVESGKLSDAEREHLRQLLDGPLKKPRRSP